MIPNPFSGAFFVVEGIDGCGKSTQVDQLHTFMATHAANGSLKTKEPNKDQFYGAKIYQDLVKGKEALHKSDYFGFQTWYACDSKEQMRSIVIPALLSGVNVAADRYRSSLVFGARNPSLDAGSQIEKLMEMNRQILGEYFIWPDAIFVLDISLETAIERSLKKGRVLDGHENTEVLAKTRQNYIIFAQKYGCHIIDGEESTTQVLKRIVEIAEPILKRKGKL